MSFFIFTPAKTALENSTLDLSTGTYYAHLVSVLPAVNSSLVSGLTIAAATTGYAPKIMTGLVYTPTKWSFDDFRFPRITFTSIINGVVICKMLGSVPAATDLPIAYAALRNSQGFAYELPPGTHAVDVDFPVNGVIEIETTYGYSSGIWSGTTPPVGDIISLMGTANNTVAFANPANNKVKIVQGHPNLLNLGVVAGVPVMSSSSQVILDFWGNSGAKHSIRVGKILYVISGANSGFNAPIHASNDPIVLTNLSSLTGWTQITAGNVSAGNASTAFSINNSDYWRFLRIPQPQFPSASPSGQFYVAFFESTLLSNSQNIVN
jgi:hypothetical protein